MTQWGAPNRGRGGDRGRGRGRMPQTLFGAPAPAPSVFGSAPVAAPALTSGFAASPAATQFTFGSGVAAPASSISSLSGNKFSAMSASVGVDIAEFLIREEAEKERESIRKGSLESLKALGVPNHHSFAQWEALQEDPEQTRLNAIIFSQKRRPGQNAMFLKEAEGIWRFYPPHYACNFECKEILSSSGFSRQIEGSGCIIEREQIIASRREGTYSTGEFYRLFTTKEAYYQSRLTNTAKAYDEEMLKFTSAIKKVNEWENDMLLGNNIKSKTSTFQSQDMYDKILEAWEDMTRPVKPATSQQGPPFASGQQTPQPTFANLPDSTSKEATTTPAFGATSESVKSTEEHPQHPALSEKKSVSPVGMKENTDNISISEKVVISSKETQTHTTLEKEEEETETLENNEEEIADFLRLWDKYNHRLEEILVQRHLKRSSSIKETI